MKAMSIWHATTSKRPAAPRSERVDKKGSGGAEEDVGRMARGNSDGNRRRTTLSDVAAHAGVSAVTASRALRNPDMVSLALRERVAVAVRDLAYVPNQLASALASARTRTIGVVVPSLTNG